jgi:hypothetical protein
MFDLPTSHIYRLRIIPQMCCSTFEIPRRRPALKEEALAKTNPVKGAPKRFQPDDELLAFLKQL